MKKIILIFLVFILSVFLSGCLKQEESSFSLNQNKMFKQKEENLVSKTKSEEKPILFILAPKNFRWEEYYETRKVLEEGGKKIEIASLNKGFLKGYPQGEAKADLTLEEVKVGDYQAIVFIGGSGAVVYQDNSRALEIAQEAVRENKVLAAICIAPTILAKAGVLKGKKATVWSSSFDKSPIKILQENGAFYLDEKVVKDGKIITANGPAAALEFGQTILSTL